MVTDFGSKLGNNSLITGSSQQWKGLLCEGTSLSLSGVFKQMLNDHFSEMLGNGKVDKAFLKDHG